jgi:hypothetical protein
VKVPDLTLRALGVLVFGYETVAIVEGLIADSKKRQRRFLTASHHAWRIPYLRFVLMAALAIHLWRDADQKVLGYA